MILLPGSHSEGKISSDMDTALHLAIIFVFLVNSTGHLSKCSLDISNILRNSK